MKKVALFNFEIAKDSPMLKQDFPDKSTKTDFNFLFLEVLREYSASMAFAIST